MSDLIERLRLCERNGKRHVGELAGEAADEIERLTAESKTKDVAYETMQEYVTELEAELDAGRS
jgi:hypothetical protein